MKQKPALCVLLVSVKENGFFMEKFLEQKVSIVSP
jgi:hypothetical protein